MHLVAEYSKALEEVLNTRFVDPGRHSVHSVWPVRSVTSPASQLLHLVCPGSSVNLPTLHSVHAPNDVCPSPILEYRVVP